MDVNASIRDIQMPLRISRLPVNDKGFPVPWFVARVGGDFGTPVWDFRVIGPGKLSDAYYNRKCWICGDKLGQYLVFTIGPICSVNRVNSEPPSHLECAQYAVQACPFLSKPRMKRNEVDLPEGPPIAGEHLSHNPGATALWITKTYKPFKVKGGTLFKLGDPMNVLWYAEGRRATRGEVLEAMYKGLPYLRHMAQLEGPKAQKECEAALHLAMNWIPKEDDNARQVRPEEHT